MRRISEVIRRGDMSTIWEGDPGRRTAASHSFRHVLFGKEPRDCVLPLRECDFGDAVAHSDVDSTRAIADHRVGIEVAPKYVVQKSLERLPCSPTHQPFVRDHDQSAILIARCGAGDAAKNRDSYGLPFSVRASRDSYDSSLIGTQMGESGECKQFLIGLQKTTDMVHRNRVTPLPVRRKPPKTGTKLTGIEPDNPSVRHFCSVDMSGESLKCISLLDVEGEVRSVIGVPYDRIAFAVSHTGAHSWVPVSQEDDPLL